VQSDSPGSQQRRRVTCRPVGAAQTFQVFVLCGLCLSGLVYRRRHKYYTLHCVRPFAPSVHPVEVGIEPTRTDQQKNMQNPNRTESRGEELEITLCLVFIPGSGIFEL